MRYYVLVRDDPGVIRPHVVAEVVRERYDDGEFRDTSLGANLGVQGAEILTRDEILAGPDGRRILADWEAQDDSSFDEHLDRELEREAHLTAATEGLATAPQLAFAKDRVRELQRRAADALVSVRRRGMKVVRHRLSGSEPSDGPPPDLTLHQGGLHDSG
jgi:hypothetical protein